MADRYLITLPISTLRSTPRYWTGRYWSEDPAQAQMFTHVDAVQIAPRLADDAQPEPIGAAWTADPSAIVIGEEFAVHHAAGITLYRVDRKYRDAGYFECVSVRGISGSHHFIGAIDTFSETVIKLGRETRQCADCSTTRAADERRDH